MKNYFFTCISIFLLAVFNLTAQTGDVKWEKFKPSPGTFPLISAANNPVQTQMLTSVDAPRDIDDSYAARIRGFIVPSQTGLYTFYVSSDDQSEFWLSSDILPSNLVKRCSLTSWASYKQWDKEAANQQSAPVSLVAGNFYYFEALMMEGGGGDHLEVGWKVPGSSVIEIIGTSYLSSEAIVDSTLTEIEIFRFDNLGVPAVGVADHDLKTIQVTVPHGTPLTTLSPFIKASFGATVSPVSGAVKDFSLPVQYTVTSANGLNTAVYTVTVSVAAPRTDNTIVNPVLVFSQVSIPGVVDNNAGTVSFGIYSGLASSATLNYEKDYFATGTVPSGTVIDMASTGSLEITAQDGSKKTYSIIYNQIPGVYGFSDAFTDNSNLTRWAVRNWNNSGNGNIFQITYQEPDQNLKITKNTSTNDYIVFTFPENLNLGLVSPRVRFRVKSEQNLTAFGAKLQDANAPVNDGNFSKASNNLSMTVAADGLFHEAIWDYTGKMGAINPFMVKYLVLSVDRTVSVALSDVRIDDFRVGVDAYPNKKPTVNPVSKPAWAYTSDGVQTITLTGITDGNSERDETISITAASSNQAVVADGNISISYDGTGNTAQISYTGTSNGTATITVTLKDNKGTVYSDEQDQETVSFVAEFRDATPGVNDAAIFGDPQFTHVNVGAGHQHIAILSGVDDGDEDTEQELTFTITNNSSDKISIDSISYVKGNSFALIYFKDKGLTGDASVTVTCIDEVDKGLGNPPYSMSFNIPLGTYDTFGAYYGATQVQQWQPMPYKQDPVFKEGYPIMINEANVVNHCKEDLFWGRMWGYIIAPVSGSYKFYSYTEGEGEGNFYLSTNATRNGLPAESTPTAKNGQASAFINLEAGKAYYFEAFHKEIINDYFLRLEWIYPGISTPVIIKAPYLFSLLDMVLPSAPANLVLKSKGSSLALVEWGASSDNLRLNGYFVYVNGKLYNEEPVKETSMMLEGLDPDTDYDVFVLAADQMKNHSKPSNILRIKTWGNDSNPPGSPSALTVTAQTTFSVSLSWNAAVDGETEVFGYNVYVNGSTDPVNTSPITSTSYKVASLEMKTGYTLSVTALDAAMNESAPVQVSATTNDFVWNDPEEDAHIGKVTVSFDALVPATGFAIEGDYGLGSLFLSNKVSYNSFEGSGFSNNMTTDALTAVQKSKSAGVSYYAETADVYHGEKAAKLEVAPGDWFRNQARITMTPSYNYLIRVAAKKDAMYAGNIGVRVFRETGGVITAYTGSFTPTTSWAEYELEFPGIVDASTTWFIEFGFTSLGTVYLDDVQMHIKEWYDPDSKFSKAGIQILDELKPAAIRWGAIDANYESFVKSVGPYQQTTMTLGDFAELGARYGGYALLTTGVNSATDWINNPNTFKNFVEYLSGPAGTTWGDVRIAEGYTEPFDERLKGIVIELGNEVWGFDAHGANAFSNNYTTYATWARNMSKNYLKASPYFNQEKMYVSFSGRSPAQNYGLHTPLFNGDTGEMDMLSISGYLGGNLNYDPAIDPGESQLDYHKNVYSVFNTNLRGLIDVTKEMFQYMGRNVPMYMYEGNLTRDEYHGTLGQAVSFADYYTAVMEYGVALPDVFCLEGGQWRILDNNITLKKRPLYYLVQYFNNFCAGGVMLKTSFESVDRIYDDNGLAINMNSLGAYFFNNDDRYGLALYSRDFENDYIIQLDLPEGIGSISEGEMVVVSGDAFNSLDATVSTTNLSVSDGMLITVPKYSAVFITFKANARNYDPMPGLGVYNYKKVENIDLYTADGSTLINTLSGYKKVLYTVSPSDAFYQGVKFEVTENSANASFSTSRNVRADGVTNGTVTVRGTALDGSGIYDEITFTITNQATSVEGTQDLGVVAYPNPVRDKMMVELPKADQADLLIRNIYGSVVHQQKLNDYRTELKLENLASGLYFMEVSTAGGTQLLRFVKY